MKKRPPMDLAIFLFSLTGALFLCIGGGLKGWKELTKTPALTEEQVVALFVAKLREQDSIKKIEEKPKMNSDDQKQIQAKEETVKGLDEKIQQATRGVPQSTLDELQRKALDLVFDDAMKQAAATAQATQAREEEKRRKHVEAMRAQEKARQDSERIAAQELADAITQGAPVIARARDVIIEVVTYAHEKRFGRKIKTELRNGSDPSQSEVVIEFDTGTAWILKVSMGDTKARFGGQPRIFFCEILAGQEKTTSGISADGKTLIIPVWDFHISYNPKSAATGGRNLVLSGERSVPTSFAPLKQDYEAGRLSDDEFIRNITLELVGRNEAAVTRHGPNNPVM